MKTSNILKFTLFLFFTFSCYSLISAQGHSHNNMTGQTGQQNAFLKMMDDMMEEMDAVALSSSVERNFLVQMIPHHKGALEMASWQIEHGTNAEMVQLAKSIQAEQKNEIMEMQSMMKSYLEQGIVSSEYRSAMDKTMELMMNRTPKSSELIDNTDCSFAKVMLPHHQAAVDMATALLRLRPKGPVAVYAQRIIGDQQIEIEQMNDYIQKRCQK